MRSLKLLTQPAVCGLLLLAVLCSTSAAAETGRKTEVAPAASAPSADAEPFFPEEWQPDAECRALQPCRGVRLGLLWCEADYLLWWTKGMEIPPLVTAGTTGVLGGTDTRILYGDEQILDDARSGFRVGLGSWLGPGRCYGLEGDYWMLGDVTDHFRAASDPQGNPRLFRPFFNVNPRDPDGEFDPPAREDAEIVSSPSLLAGAAMVDSYSELQGAGIRVRRLLCCDSSCDACCDECGREHVLARNSRLDLLLGYRFVQLRDGIAVREDLTSLLSAPDQGDFDIVDEFRTMNNFHGADLGVAWRRRSGPWQLDVLGKLALGSTEQSVTIGGQTVISGSTADNGTYAGGLLAQRTNIGSYQRNVFSVVPELNIGVGYALTRCLTARVGYNFLYWSRVARAGEQIDLDVNPDLLPPEEVFVGAERPQFEFRDTDFWAQGIRVGLEGTW